jgi:hypothetical protein
MLLKTKQEIFNTNTTEVLDYRLPNSDESIRLLMEAISVRMYTDPLTAVVREISCNAVDANKDAGRGHVPIRIYLPNKAIKEDKVPHKDQLENHLVIEDDGNGISPEGMRIFTTIMESTKRDSNNLIGGYGLGSKSPFSITNIFDIITNHEGIQYAYTCAVDNGLPKCLLHYTRSTTEVGTSIRIPIINDEYLSRLKKIVINTCAWFDVAPVFNSNSMNETVREIREYLNYDLSKPYYTIPILDEPNQKKINYVYQDTGLRYPELKYRGYLSPVFIIGGVPYTITDDKVAKTLVNAINSTIPQPFLRGIEPLIDTVPNLVIPIPIGVIDLSVQRETPIWNEKTINYLRNKMVEVFTSLIGERNKTLDEAASLEKAYTIAETWQFTKEFSWKGITYNADQADYLFDPIKKHDHLSTSYITRSYDLPSDCNVCLVGSQNGVPIRLSQNLAASKAYELGPLLTSKFKPSNCTYVPVYELKSIVVVVTNDISSARNLRKCSNVPLTKCILWVRLTDETLNEEQMLNVIQDLYPKWFKLFDEVISVKNKSNTSSYAVDTSKPIRSWLSNIGQLTRCDHVIKQNYKELPEVAIYTTQNSLDLRCKYYDREKDLPLYYATPRQVKAINQFYPQWVSFDEWACNRIKLIVEKYGGVDIVTTYNKTQANNNFQQSIGKSLNLVNVVVNNTIIEHQNPHLRQLILDGLYCEVFYLIQYISSFSTYPEVDRDEFIPNVTDKDVFISSLFGDKYNETYKVLDCCKAGRNGKIVEEDVMCVIDLINKYYAK